MDEILQEFIQETTELIANMEAKLVVLDGARADLAPIHEIFRGAHTIKGNSAFLEFYPLADVTHAMEDLLHRVRDGTLAPSDPVMETLFAALDMVKRIFAKVAAGEPVDFPHEAICERIAGIVAGVVPAGPPPSPPPAPASPAPVPVPASPPEPEAPATPASPAGPAEESSGANRLASSDIAGAKGAPSGIAQAADETLRIKVGRLNHLIDLIGEMVTISSGFQMADRRLADPPFSKLNLRMGKVLKKLRDLSLGLRMLPISHLFDRFPRLVRDLAKKTGKKVRLTVAGGDAEIDRNIIEELYDPLLHLVRNCVDHGIEPPGQRARSGKDETGTVSLVARHLENHIVIEVADDGLGINQEAVLEKAYEVGLVKRGEAAGLSLDDVINLIFEPGFSTNEKVTDLSGRGVGMDVVRSRVETLHGIVSVHTETGTGTRFELRLPLTLAILQVLLVESGGSLFGLPLLSVVETLKLDPAAVEREPDYAFMNFRGDSLRLVTLADLLGRPGPALSSAPAPAERPHAIVIRHGEKRVGVLVDRLGGKFEIVLKPLGNWLGHVRGVMGAAVLGDGRLVPILEIGALIRERLHD